MMTIPEIVVIGSSWLLTYALHSTLLLVAGWVLASRLRSSVLRDTVWKAAMFGGLLTSAFQIGAGYTPYAGQLHMVPTEVDRPATHVSASAPVLQAEIGTAGAAVTPEAAAAVGPGVTIQTPTTSVPSSVPVMSKWRAALADKIRSIHLPTTLLILWLVGAALGVLRLVWARVRLARCLHNRRDVSDPNLRRYLDSFTAVADIQRPIRMTWSSALTAPAALRSEVCLPRRALFDMDVEKHRSIIAHEVAHIARRDPTWFMLCLLLERVFFFQPLNRLARRHVQSLAEFICDDWAVYRAGTKRSLAESLAEVAGWITHTRPVTMLPSAGQDRSQLVRRVERILEPNLVPEAWMPKRSRGAAVLVALLLISVVVPGVSCARAGAEAAEPATFSPNEAPPVDAIPQDDFQPLSWSEVEGETLAATGNDAADAWASMQHAIAGPDVSAQVAWDTASLDDAVVFSDVRGVVAQAANLNAQISQPTETAFASAAALSYSSQPASTKAQQEPLDPRVIRGLVEALRDENEDVRKEAANALGRIGDTSAVMPLASALSDPQPVVRAAAASALSRFRDARAVPALSTALGDSVAGVRKYALRALVRTKHESVVPALMNALDDDSPEVREMAVDALGDLKDPRAVPGLITAVRDPHPDVREEAIQSLYQIRDGAAVPALIEATRDTSAKVRRVASSALGHFGDTTAVPALIDRLGDSAAIVRRYAVQSLGRLADARAIDPLVDALKDEDSDVRMAAVRALAQLRESDTW